VNRLLACNCPEITVVNFTHIESPIIHMYVNISVAMPGEIVSTSSMCIIQFNLYKC